MKRRLYMPMRNRSRDNLSKIRRGTSRDKAEKRGRDVLI